MSKILFLPGAGGAAGLWQPVADLLPVVAEKILFSWPGLGDEPHDPAIAGIEDLVSLVHAHMDGPVDLVAQSMGGVVAARLALCHPALVRRLVLVVTSAGVNMAGLGTTDWRAEYRTRFPHAAGWIAEPRAAPALPVENIAAPTLLIWGDADPISPVAVGEHLQGRIPDATLHLVPGGGHDLAVTHADTVAAWIGRHLAAWGTDGIRRACPGG